MHRLPSHTWELLTVEMGSENAILSRGSSDKGQESRPAAGPLDLNPVPATSWLCGLRPALPFSRLPLSTGDDKSTCRRGLLKVSVAVNCSRRGFFLDRMA